MYQELKYFHCHPVEDDYARRGITEIRGRIHLLMSPFLSSERDVNWRRTNLSWKHSYRSWNIAEWSPLFICYLTLDQNIICLHGAHDISIGSPPSTPRRLTSSGQHCAEFLSQSYPPNTSTFNSHHITFYLLWWLLSHSAQWANKRCINIFV